MASKAHLSRNLANLIQTIGQTNSKEAEDTIIQAEITNLKSNIALNPREEDFFEILIKLLYIETLGHDAQFAHIHAVNLTQSKNLKMKRLGYLLVTLCIKTNSKFSILLLSTIQKDLSSTNLHHVVICLAALPKLINSIIIEACLQTIVKLTKHQTDLVRKKALLVMQRIYQLDPDKIPTFKTILQEALHDDEPPVVFGAIIIIKQLVEEHPERYKELTDNFCVVLRDIITHKYRKEYDYHRVPAPWMQITLLRLLEILGKNDPKSSAKMYEVLQKTLRRSTYNQLHVSNAILIQSIRTICTIYPNQGLITEAKDFIWRFFEKENHNMKCFGLGVLNVLAKTDPSAIKSWQYQIIDCLESEDTTLATSAVELLAKISNQQNCQTIIEKLIDVAKKETDKNFQIKLIKKCLTLTQLHSSTPEIYISTMNHILINFHNLIDTRSLNSYINVLIEAIESNSEYITLILDKYEELLQTTEILHILKVSVFMIGEYAGKAYGANAEKIQSLVNKILEVGFKLDDPPTLQYIVQALVKISTVEGFKQYQQIKDFLLKLQASDKIQIYKVAEEMSRLGKFGKAMYNSHSLKIDPNLSFLDGFLTESGTPLQKKPSERSGLIPLKKLVQQSSLNLKPYSIGEHKKKTYNQKSLVEATTVALVDIQDESVLRFAGPRKWTPAGYADRLPERKQASEEQPRYLPNQEVIELKPNKFTIKGPKDKQSAPQQKITVDQRKVNLARNIFK